MNLKGFKKVHEDNEKAVMKNHRGHSITIAKRALSPQLLESLKKIPLHAYSGTDTGSDDDDKDQNSSSNQPVVNVYNSPPPNASNMQGTPTYYGAGNTPAPGTAPPENLYNPSFDWMTKKRTNPVQGNMPYPSEAAVDQSQKQDYESQQPTVEPPEETTKSSASQQNPPEQPSPASIEPPQPQDNTPAQPTMPESSEEEPEEAPTPAPAISPVQNNPVAAQQNHAITVRNYLSTQDKAFENDLNNGHIKPKTYSDLFHDKSTLGKIGTIFGLVLSGVGSGMAHQPNAALAMMQQELSNDLDAQKTSKANAQNFLRINQAQQLQDAQIPKMFAEKKLTEAQAKLAYADANIKATALTQMQKNRAAFHSLVDITNKLPVGSPQRQKAEQMLGVMYQATDNQSFNIADRAAAASAALNFGQDQQEGNNPSDVTSTAMKLRGLHLAKMIDDGQYNKANEELKLIGNKQQANQGALDSFDKVANLVTTSGRLNNFTQVHKKVSAEWDPMLDKLTKSNEGRVTPITVEMMNGIKPAWGDTRDTKAIKRQKLSEILNSGFSTPILDGLGLSQGKGMGSNSNTEERLDRKSGKTAIFDAKTKKFINWK